jgi:hypothetical protein
MIKVHTEHSNNDTCRVIRVFTQHLDLLFIVSFLDNVFTDGIIHML